VPQSNSSSSLLRFRAILGGALLALEERRSEINDLNVFPVADGDTGDNMVLTIEGCLAELDRLAEESGERSLDEIGREEIVDLVARAALLSARGNSGVILSQLIRGAAEELISRPGVLVDPVLIALAMQRAAERAYASVREPAEGTILTVMADMATAVTAALEQIEPMPADATPDQQNARIAELLEIAVIAGEESVRRGPELLPVLKAAGVVDSGGYGVVVLFAGCVTALRGEQGLSVAHHVAPARSSEPQHESSTFRFCTNFAVTATTADRLATSEQYIAQLEELGDSVLVVGDQVTLRVHVHTDEPAAATALFAEVGQVSRLDVADMSAQIADREERLASEPAVRSRCGTLAIVAGDGIAQLYRSLGAHVLDGGETLNPSTYEILAGIHSVPADEVVVLPNSRNVFMAAQAAAEMSERTVHVAQSSEMQAGLAALVASRPERSAAENAAEIDALLVHVRSGSVARAARADGEGRFAEGDAVGYVGEELVAWGEPEATLGAVIEALAQGSELLTVIAGVGAPIDQAGVRSLAPAALELEQHEGGQLSRWWLLSAE
jgi:DAK2 domain fusion protein YloV